jgi:hypothetical protein
MKNKAIGFILLVFIYGGIASEFGWIGGNKIGQPKPKEVLIDSIKIDSTITIKIYRNGRTD